MFDVLLNGALEKSAVSTEPWHDICQKPMIYPPPDGHQAADKSSKVEQEP